MPLIGAAVIQSLSWQWVFWIFTMIGGVVGLSLLLFVPQTSQEQAPESRFHSQTFAEDVRPPMRQVPPSGTIEQLSKHKTEKAPKESASMNIPELKITTVDALDKKTIAERRGLRTVGFAQEPEKVAASNDDPMARILIDHTDSPREEQPKSAIGEIYGARTPKTARDFDQNLSSDYDEDEDQAKRDAQQRRPSHRDLWRIQPEGQGPQTPELHNFNSPSYTQPEFITSHGAQGEILSSRDTDLEAQTPATASIHSTNKSPYTEPHINIKSETFLQSLKPWHERVSPQSWIKLATQPFTLFTSPSILWASLIYALSIGWLIIISETITSIYHSPNNYNFTTLQCGLIYLSPFIGGTLGTLLAPKINTLAVYWTSKRTSNNPATPLPTTIPIFLLSTTTGLIGYGWSSQERSPWILPTIFLGILAFGSSLGAMTALTFAMESHPQQRAETLVSLAFSKSKPLAPP